MHRDFKSYKDITERRKIIGTYASQGRLEVDLIKHYETLPDIKPWRGIKIWFYDDGIEAVVNEVIEDNKSTYNAVLVDEGRKQIIMFHYRKEETLEGGVRNTR